MHLILFSFIFWVTYQCHPAEETISHHFHAMQKKDPVKKRDGIQEFLFVHYTQKEMKSDEWQLIETESGIWNQVNSYLPLYQDQETSEPITIRSAEIICIILGKIYYNARTKSGSWQIAQHEAYKPSSKESLCASLVNAYEQSLNFLKRDEQTRKGDDNFMHTLLAIEGSTATFNQTAVLAKEFQL